MKIERVERSRTLLHQGFLKVLEFVSSLKVTRGDEEHDFDVVREVCIVGGSVAGILVDVANKRVLVIRQYREPVTQYMDYGRPGIIDEAVAGMVDENEDGDAAFIREMKEETGVVLHEHDIKDSFRYFPSPGYSSECTEVFLAETSSNTVIPEVLSGGLPLEGEIIEPLWLTFAEIRDLWRSNELRDGKLLLALWEAGVLTKERSQ